MWLDRLAMTNKDRSFWFNHLRLILGLSSRPRHRGIFVPFNPEINARHPRINLVAGEGASRRAVTPGMDHLLAPPARLSLAPAANVNFIEPEYPRSESMIEEGTSA